MTVTGSRHAHGFDKLVQVPRFGCSYQSIADTTCSATTIRDRRDECIAVGVFTALARIARDAYDCIVGLPGGQARGSKKASNGCGLGCGPAGSARPVRHPPPRRSPQGCGVSASRRVRTGQSDNFAQPLHLSLVTIFDGALVVDQRGPVCADHGRRRRPMARQEEFGGRRGVAGAQRRGQPVGASRAQRQGHRGGGSLDPAFSAPTRSSYPSLGSRAPVLSDPQDDDVAAVWRR